VSRIEVTFLGSGSSGNCAVVRANGTSVLVDAGLSTRETERRLALRGMSLDAISAIFLTHEHADHVHAALDLNRRRGMILATEEAPGGAQIITANVPLSEMFGYATDMRSKTQGRATYTMEFSHYEKAPKSVEEEIIAKASGKKPAA